MTIQQFITQHQETCNLENSSLPRIRLKDVKKNEILIQPGAVVSDIFFIRSGVIRSYFLDSRGRDKTCHIAFPGSLITDLRSFTSRIPGVQTIEAVENACLEQIHRDQLDSLLDRIPSFRDSYMRFLEAAYRKQNEQLADLYLLNAAERYNKLISGYPEYILRLPNRILASYLNMTQETLSRLKRC